MILFKQNLRITIDTRLKLLFTFFVTLILFGCVNNKITEKGYLQKERELLVEEKMRPRQINYEISEKELKIIQRSLPEEDRIQYLIAIRAWDELHSIDDSKIVLKFLIPALPALKDIDTQSKCRIITILGDSGSNEAIEPLLLFLKDKSNDIRSFSAYELGNFNDSLVIDTLIGLLNSDSTSIKGDIIRSLAKIGNPKALPYIIFYTSDTNEGNRECAIEALDSFDDDLAFNTLISFFNDKNKKIREIAANTLFSSRNKKILPFLINCLQTEQNSRILIEAIFKIQYFDPDKAREILPALLNHPDADVRALTIDALTTLKVPPSRHFYETSLKHPNPEIRVAAIQGLESETDSIAINLIRPYLHDPNSDVRTTALSALGYLGDSKIIPQLIDVLSQEKLKHQTYTSAIEALADINDSLSIQTIIQCLQHSNKIIQESAIVTLGELGEKTAVQPLIQYCLEDSELNYKTVQALESIGDSLAEEALINDFRMSKSSNLSMAARTLGKLKSRKAVKPLLESLQTPQSIYSKDVILALGEIQDTSAVDKLISLLNDKNGYYKRDAAIALGNLRDKRATKALIRVLNDPDGDNRAQAVLALGKIGDKQAVKYLIPLINNSHEYVSYYSIISLGELKDPSAVTPLLNNLNKLNNSDFIEAVMTLGKIGDKRATKKLIDYLKNPKYRNRSYCAEALGMIGDTTAIGVLINCLNDEDDHVKAASAYALGKMPDTRAVLPLMKCLYDPFRSIRINSIWSLGMIGDPLAYDTLLTFVKPTDDQIARLAVEAIGKFKNKNAIPTLLSVLPSWEANQEICFALDCLGWKPTTPEEQVYYWIGKKNKQMLLEHWEQAKQVLQKDLVSDGRKRKNAAFTLICLGKEEFINDLCNLLKVNPDKNMATAYSKCKKRKLSKIGQLQLKFSNQYYTTNPIIWASW